MKTLEKNPLLPPLYTAASTAIAFSFDLQEASFRRVNDTMGAIYELLDATGKEAIDGSRELMELLSGAVEILRELSSLEPPTSSWSTTHLEDIEKHLTACEETYAGEDFSRYYGSYVARVLLQEVS